jgi:hypothetical protein
MIKKIIHNDIFIRAVKTFIQGFLGAFIVFLNNNTTLDKNVLKSALIGALASGLSALMNFILELLKKGDK